MNHGPARIETYTANHCMDHPDRYSHLAREPLTQPWISSSIVFTEDIHLIREQIE